MDYKGYELRFNVRWLVKGRTHNAAVGVFKHGEMLAPCADIHLAQRWIDQRIKTEGRLARERGREGSDTDSPKPKRVRSTRSPGK